MATSEAHDGDGNVLSGNRLWLTVRLDRCWAPKDILRRLSKGRRVVRGLWVSADSSVTYNPYLMSVLELMLMQHRASWDC